MAAIKTAKAKEMVEKIEQAEILIDEPKLVKLGEKFYVPENFEDDHNYYADEARTKRYWGITTVLSVIAKPALIAWASNSNTETLKTKGIKAKELFFPFVLNELYGNSLVVTEELLEEGRVAHTKKKEKAGELGTAIHEELERLIKSSMELNKGKIEAFMLKEDMPEQVKQFMQWAIVNDVKFLASEQRLYSEKLWVAGTADFVCEIAGKLFVGDIKTSSAIYSEMFLQATAYAHMAREMKLYKDFKGVVIVNIPKHGGLQVKENYDLKGNFQAFKAALTLFKFKEGHKVKRIKK